MASPSIFGWCLLGIVISVLLPGLWASVRQHFPNAPGNDQKGVIETQGILDVMKPYLVLGAASACTAFLVLAFAGESLTDPRAALLAGYAWDSTLQKLKS